MYDNDLYYGECMAPGSVNKYNSMLQAFFKVSRV